MEYLKLGEEVIKKSKGFLGNLDEFYSVRSFVFMDQGKYKEALENMEIAINKSKDNSDDRSIFISYEDKALILVRLERYKEAYELVKIAKAGLDKQYKNYPNAYTALSLNIMASCEYGMENLSKAEEYADEGIKILEDGVRSKRYNRTYPYFYIIKGDIYFARQDFIRAKENYVKAKQIYEKIFKDPKIDDTKKLYQKLAKLDAIN